MKPLRDLCIAEGKGLNCRPFPRPPSLAQSGPAFASLRIGRRR